MILLAGLHDGPDAHDFRAFVVALRGSSALILPHDKHEVGKTDNKNGNARIRP
jgi:hypothetical protein